ncbi:MAG: DUF3794 domain-containing protein [Clostridia bacterium]|nr:DUF3794 domain-containing protein [Clostridia bacterium]
MAFSQTETNFRVQKKVEACQVNVKDKVLASVGSPKQIMGYQVTPRITSVEEVGDVVNFSGNACVSVMFLSADNEVSGARENVEFASSFEKGNLTDIWLSPMVNDSSLTIVENEARVSFNVKVDCFGQQETNICQISDNDDNVVTKTEDKTILNLSCASSEEFTLTEEIKEPKVIEEVVLASGIVNVLEVSSEENMVVASGVLNVKLTYKTGDDLTTSVKEIPFKQELAISGATPDDNANVSLYLSNLSATINSNENAENETNISLIASFNAISYCYQEKTITQVIDAFSTVSETNTVLTADCVNSYFSEPSKNQYADSVINIENYPEFDEIVSVNACQTYLSGNNEGVVLTIVSLKDREGNIISINENVPVIISGEVKENAQAIVSSYHNRGGKELEINYVFASQVSSVKETNLNYVSNLEEISEIVDESDMKMYVVKENETLFDVCRALKVNPSVVASQNENTDSLAKGDKVFVYFPKTANFEE